MKRLQIALFTILVIAGCNTTKVIPEPKHDDRDPSLVRLQYHLGKGKDEMTSKLEKKYGLIQKKFGKGGRFYNESHSFTYFYIEDKLVKLVLTVQQPIQTLRAYTGDLPYGLLRRDTFDSVLKKFGTPSSQGEDKNFLKYDDKRLTVYFSNGTISAVSLTAE